MSEATRPRGSLNARRSIIVGLVGLAVVAFVFLRVIPQVGSYEDALTALETMTLPALVGIVVSVVAYLAAYGLPVMASVPGLSYWRAQQLNQAAFAVSNGVPAGAAFGLGVQYEILESFGVGPSDSEAAITANDVWDLSSTLAFPIVGVVAIELSGQAARSYVWPAVLGLLVLVAAIVAFVLVIRSEAVTRWVASLGNRIVGPFVRRFRKGHPLDLVAVMLRYREAIAGLVGRRWRALTAAELLVAFAQFLIFYVSLRGVEGWRAAGTPFLAAFGSFAIAQIALLIPITPGGLGTADATMIAAMTGLGVSAGVATAADLVWRAASFVPQMVIGLVSLITWSWREARRTAGGTHVELGGSPGRVGP